MKDKVLAAVAIGTSATLLGIYFYDPSIITTSKVGTAIILIFFFITGYCVGSLIRRK